MSRRTDRCPGCHGSGIEMSGVTYAGMSEHVGCHECGPECPDDCGCRASDATERPKSVALRHPGATQSPDGSPSATEGLRGPEGAVTDAEAAQWAALADAATEGPWHVQGPVDEEDDWAVYGPTRQVRHGSAAWARGEGHPRLCSGPSGADANFISAARIAVPRLSADRERLTAALAGLTGDFDRLTSERNRLWAAVFSMLGPAAAKGECACGGTDATFTRPQEDCPLHGRTYAEWVGLAGTACADRERLTAENAALWAEVGRLSVVADCDHARAEADNEGGE